MLKSSRGTAFILTLVSNISNIGFGKIPATPKTKVAVVAKAKIWVAVCFTAVETAVFSKMNGQVRIEKKMGMLIVRSPIIPHESVNGYIKLKIKVTTVKTHKKPV